MTASAPPLVAIDADALVVHAARALRAPHEALYALFPQDTALDPDFTLPLIWRWKTKTPSNVTLAWSPHWVDVAAKAKELWTPRALAFLAEAARGPMPMEAAALVLERALTEQVRSHLLLAVRALIRADRHDRLVGDWHAAPADSTKEAAAMRDLKAIFEEWRGGRVGIRASDWAALLSATMDRAITATAKELNLWSAQLTVVCSAETSATAAAPASVEAGYDSVEARGPVRRQRG